MVPTHIPQRRLGRRGLALSAGVVSMALIAGACGSSEPSAEQAREVLLRQFADEGVSTEIAECIVDGALAQFEPGELVNTSGEASDEVNAAVSEIVADCSIPETTIPDTTIPDTTVPETSSPEATSPEPTVPETTAPATTVSDLDLTAFCVTSEDVYIALIAGDLFDAPTPATMEAFFAEVIDRTELAIVTAPSSDYTTQPNELLTAVESIDQLLADNGYDVTLVPDGSLEAESDVVEQVQSDLEGFLADNCESTNDVDAEAQSLADQLTALGGDAPVVDGDTRAAESVDLFITSDVPATWTSEFSEAVDGRRVFIVAIDAEAFKTSWATDGVRFTGIDTTEDYLPLMDATKAVLECTFVVEEDYNDGLYEGKLRRYEGCAGDTEAVVIGANDIDEDGTVLVELQMVEFDQAVLDTITESFVA